MKEKEEIRANFCVSPEEMDRLDKSKISYITMKDGDIFKIKDESKDNIFFSSPQVSELQKFKNEYSNNYFNDTFYTTHYNNICSIHSPLQRCYGRLIADKGNIMIYESGIESINNGNYGNENVEKFECVAGDDEFVVRGNNYEKNKKNVEKKRKVRCVSQKNIKNNRNLISINSEDTGTIVYRNDDENCPVFPFISGIRRRYRYGKYIPTRKINYNYKFVYPDDLESFYVSEDKRLYANYGF